MKEEGMREELSKQSTTICVMGIKVWDDNIKHIQKKSIQITY